MRKHIIGFLGALLFASTTYAACPDCCQTMGGIQYCDSSAGRFVCNNGYYSTCYCDRHAVMELALLKGCCLWQGGVLAVDDINGVVVCNDGGVSEVCSLQHPVKSYSIW